MQEKKIFQQLTSKNLLEIYTSKLVGNKEVSFPPPFDAEGKLESIVATATGSLFGSENYPKPEYKIVAYLYFIIKDHPFVDGNKRIAVYALTVLADINSLHLRKVNLAELAVFVEKYSATNHHEFIKRIADIIFEP